MNKLLNFFKSPILLIGVAVFIIIGHINLHILSIENLYLSAVLRGALMFFICQFINHMADGMLQIFKDYIHNDTVVDLIELNINILRIICMIELSLLFIVPNIWYM